MALEWIMNHFYITKIDVLPFPKASYDLVIVTLQLKGHSYADNCTFLGPRITQFIKTKLV
jgi:hypothetical protein